MHPAYVVTLRFLLKIKHTSKFFLWGGGPILLSNTKSTVWFEAVLEVQYFEVYFASMSSMHLH